MSETATPFRQRAAGALNDTFLRQALTIATTKFIDLRREAFGDFPEGEALREQARQIKEATLQHLDRYLDELIDNVERAMDRPGTTAAALAAVRGQHFLPMQDRYRMIDKPTLLLWGHGHEIAHTFKSDHPIRRNV